MKQEYIEIGGILLCAGIFLAANAADTSQLSNGNWELNSWTRGDSVQLSMKRHTLTSHWSWSSPHAIADLHRCAQQHRVESAIDRAGIRPKRLVAVP